MIQCLSEAHSGSSKTPENYRIHPSIHCLSSSYCEQTLYFRLGIAREQA